ncbi:MAG: tRNA (adenosine(37)-N6)-threonylcarbamoyltransferase complex dimerization subunit type 1 TsaB [Pirellulaceae bacterium]|nr:tRNA (adenosine(37)-N6)-threonylcarbamoyltransferase complex dimerization subunit type 1 TsaB [Pirellulaceae bacterium]
MTPPDAPTDYLASLVASKVGIESKSPQKTVHLAIETTGQSGSLALLMGDTVLQTTQLGSDQRTASSLAPALDQMLGWACKSDCRVGFVSVAQGPGSFTGLRIGITTAKTLCYATSLPLIGIDSVAAVAAAYFAQEDSCDQVLVGLNAYRGQVFTGQFQRESLLPALPDVPAAATGIDGNRSENMEDRVSIVDQEQWLTLLGNLPGSQVCVGDAKMFAKSERAKFQQRQISDAVGVGQLAIRAAMAGAFRDPMTLVPRYLKPSAAEENLRS